MQEHNSTFKKSLSISNYKDTDIVCFLIAAKYLKPLSNSVVIKLANRFSITPEHLVILIEVSRKGGGLIWN